MSFAGNRTAVPSTTSHRPSSGMRSKSTRVSTMRSCIVAIMVYRSLFLDKIAWILYARFTKIIDRRPKQPRRDPVCGGGGVAGGDRCGGRAIVSELERAADARGGAVARRSE